MKYFTYDLFTQEDGSLIGPASKLPADSRTGISDGTKFYGSANVESLADIQEFNPVEISKELFDRYASPAPPITARQFYMQAEKEGLLTKQEVSDALKHRTIPTSMQAILDGITDTEEKFKAEMQIIAALNFDRNNPLSETIGLAFGKTTYQIDQFFRDAATI
jgi:hypothetical protein